MIDNVGFSLFRVFTLIVFLVATVGIRVVSDVMINGIPTCSYEINRSSATRFRARCELRIAYGRSQALAM